MIITENYSKFGKNSTMGGNPVLELECSQLKLHCALTVRPTESSLRDSRRSSSRNSNKMSD